MALHAAKLAQTATMMGLHAWPTWLVCYHYTMLKGGEGRGRGARRGEGGEGREKGREGGEGGRGGRRGSGSDGGM